METKRHNDPLKIRISGLSNGIYEHHFSSGPSDVGLESNFSHPVNVDAVIDKTPHQIYLKAEIATSGAFTCDRCLEGFEQAVAVRFAMLYIFEERGAEAYPPHEVQVISPDTVVIDFTEDVRQMITLSVPLKLLCKEDCKGLCPRCGTNWNKSSCNCKDDQTDPRWEGLAKLLKN